MRRHFHGLLGPAMLALGVLPPLPEPEPRLSPEEEEGGDRLVDAIGLGVAEVQRDEPRLQSRVTGAATANGTPRPHRADPDRKARRKAQKQARRRNR